MVAEDLAQDALLKACGRWSKVSTMTVPGAWLHRVAINLANSYFRRRKAERHVAETTVAMATSESAVWSLTVPRPLLVIAVVVIAVLAIGLMLHVADKRKRSSGPARSRTWNRRIMSPAL